MQFLTIFDINYALPVSCIFWFFISFWTIHIFQLLTLYAPLCVRSNKFLAGFRILNSRRASRTIVYSSDPRLTNNFRSGTYDDFSTFCPNDPPNPGGPRQLSNVGQMTPPPKNREKNKLQFSNFRQNDPPPHQNRANYELHLQNLAKPSTHPPNVWFWSYVPDQKLQTPLPSPT